ncbi:MAG: UbiX family flavin prenyltransferase [Parvibaculum sp.]|nr:UbiX family flavin prenyltransferase [Parvibaculum sp.]
MAKARATPKPNTKRLIVGISGASGIIYGVRLLEILKAQKIETHLVMTKAAELTLAHETGMSPRDIEALAHTRYQLSDIGAAIASGSFKTLGMVVAPCSIRSMSEIATGVTSNLLTRAADVVLKERRRLVLMVRETPLHTGHLRTMTHLSEIGAIIAPPMPAFYAAPKSIDDIVTQSVARVLDLFDIETDVTKRWGEDLKGGKRSPVRPAKKS